MNTMKTMMAVAALALATGNVQAKPRPVRAPKTGTVIVYRKPTPGSYLSWNPLTGFFGSALAGAIDAAKPFPLYVNGQLACKLRYNCYYQLELSPGDYDFGQTRWQKGGWWLTGNRKSVHVVAGQTLYFSYYEGAYHVAFEVAEDQNEAKQDVNNLKPQN